MRLIEIRINCPDREIAGLIGERLVAARLAACANIGSQVDSIYRWAGEVRRAAEVPLVVRTRATLFGAVAAEAAALHPWQVPSITAVEIAEAAPSYRDWMVAQTQPE